MENPIVIPVHEHGHVALEDYMGSDLSIVNNARVSFNDQDEEMNDRNKGLVRYLMNNKHGTPFESVTLRFDIKLPLFVCREWQRHRIGHSYNEQSARYSEIDDLCYVPQRNYIRTQVGKPGAYIFETIKDDDEAEWVMNTIADAQGDAFTAYHQLLERNVAKEIARLVLPVGMYTRMKWTCNLRSVMHWLGLRNKPDAQREIRDYAVAVEHLVMGVCPVAMQYFIDNGRVAP